MKASRCSILIHAVVAVGLLGWLVHHLATVTSAYTARLDCANLPADDTALRDWVAAQPGVQVAAVRREGATVVVVFEQAPWGDAPVANLIEQATRLGYHWRGFTVHGRGH
jgi:hypothetical protein